MKTKKKGPGRRGDESFLTGSLTFFYRPSKEEKKVQKPRKEGKEQYLIKVGRRKRPSTFSIAGGKGKR